MTAACSANDSAGHTDYRNGCLPLHSRRLNEFPPEAVQSLHTLSIAFRHLPPNSARFGYATERELFISVQLSTDAVSTLQKVWVLTRLWKQPRAQVHT